MAYHISKDGVARQCRAKSPESCTATPADQKEHYDSKEDAQAAYEKSQEKQTLSKLSKNPAGSEKINEQKNKIIAEKLSADIEFESDRNINMTGASWHVINEQLNVYDKTYQRKIDEIKKSGALNDKELQKIEQKFNDTKFIMAKNSLDAWDRDHGKELKDNFRDSYDTRKTLQSKFEKLLDKSSVDVLPSEPKNYGKFNRLMKAVIKKRQKSEDSFTISKPISINKSEELKAFLRSQGFSVNETALKPGVLTITDRYTLDKSGTIE